MKFRFLQIAALILLAAGAQPAYSAFWQWSKTSATNAGADPTINWAEGMSPSSVNDSARAMMARSAEYRDDISGLLNTTGTATAYVVATNQGLCTTTGATAPNDGQQLAVTVNATNGIAPTLTADGCNAAPIQSSPGVAVPSATLISGNPYTLKYSVSNSAWMLSGFFGSALSVPLGSMIPYTLATVPSSNFVFPAGQCLSTTTYATYWVALGSPASGTCPGGQFQIVDLSGRLVAGLDTMPGFSAANRLTNSTAGCGTSMTSVGTVCANGSQSQTLTLTQLPVGITSVQNQGFNVTVASGATNVDIGVGGSTTGGGGIGINVVASTGQIVSTGTVPAGNVTTTSNNTGGASHPIVPPIIGLTYLLRVL